MRRVGYYALCASLVLFCSALILYFTVDQAIKHGVYQSLILSPHAARYADWVDIKGDQRVEFWLWNVTNPTKLSSGHEPVVRQVGPFTYRVKRHKYNVTFNQNASAVSYSERYDLQFDRASSVAEEQTRLTVFNFAAFSILSEVDAFPGWVRKLLAAAIYAFERDAETKSFIATSRDVKSTLFGYEDPFLKALKQNIPFFSDIDDKVRIIPNPAEDQLEISTGTRGAEPPQTVLKWRGRETLDFYDNKYCNMINGTDGTLFPQPLGRYLRVFLPDLCRSVELEREGTSGKTLVNYRLSSRSQANSSINPDNACFDKFGSSLFAIPCQKAPIVMSNPHFFGANSRYTNISIGMEPTAKEHLTRLSIDKISGYPVIVNKRLQVNFLSPKHSDFSLFRPDVLYPLLWVNESFHARPEDISLLWRRLHVPKLASAYASISLGGIAAVSIVVGAILIFLSSSRDEAAEEPDANESSPLLHNAY